MIVHPYKIQVGTYIQTFHLKYVYIIAMGAHLGGGGQDRELTPLDKKHCRSINITKIVLLSLLPYI